MNFEALFSTALSLFLFILTGFVLRKTGVVDGTFTGKLSGFVAKSLPTISHHLFRRQA